MAILSSIFSHNKRKLFSTHKKKSLKLRKKYNEQTAVTKKNSYGEANRIKLKKRNPLTEMNYGEANRIKPMKNLYYKRKVKHFQTKILCKKQKLHY